MKNLKSLVHRETFFFLIIILTGLILRAVYIWYYHSSPFWENLTVDARFHYLWAQSIATGDFWGNDVFFRAPFYAYFLALLYMLFSGKILGIIIIQNLIGLVSMYLTFRLSKKIYGKAPAVICSILYLITFDFVFFESELLLDFLLVFFLPLFFLICFKAYETKKKALWLLAGLILGLASITRPTVLILVALVPLLLLNSKLPDFKIPEF